MKYAIISILLSLLTLTYISKSQPTEIDILYSSKLPAITVKSFQISDYELELCARLVAGEAYNEPDSGQIAVLNVVRNRLLYHPKKRYRSIKQVILASGQFDGVGTSNWNNPNRHHYDIAKRAMIDQESVLDSTYFYFHNPNKDSNGNYISTDRRHVRLVEKKGYIDIGNHRFCKR